MTPWVANGALSLGGRGCRVGGLGARGTARAARAPTGCELRLPGERGLTRRGAGRGARGDGRRLALRRSRRGLGHDVVNCSVAALELTVELPGEGAPSARCAARTARAYELGMRRARPRRADRAVRRRLIAEPEHSYHLRVDAGTWLDRRGVPVQPCEASGSAFDRHALQIGGEIRRRPGRCQNFSLIAHRSYQDYAYSQGAPADE